MVAFIGGVGGQELLLVLAIALVVFGPKRLPEIARTLSRVTAQLRDANRELKREIYTSMDPEADAAVRRADEAARQARQAPAVPPPAPAAPAAPVGDAPLADPDAPYRDAEAEAAAARRAAAESAPAPAPARENEPENDEADPEDSGSAS